MKIDAQIDAALALGTVDRCDDGPSKLFALRCTLAAHVAGSIVGNGAIGCSDDNYCAARGLRVADAIITRALETTNEG